MNRRIALLGLAAIPFAAQLPTAALGSHRRRIDPAENPHAE